MKKEVDDLKNTGFGLPSSNISILTTTPNLTELFGCDYFKNQVRDAVVRCIVDGYQDPNETENYPKEISSYIKRCASCERLFRRTIQSYEKNRHGAE